MHKKNYKRTITKRSLSKCKLCKTYNEIMYLYADKLEAKEEIAEFQTCVPIQVGDEQYTSDFYCRRTDNTIFVRECCTKASLYQPSTAKLLDSSRNYWIAHGITDWGIVVNETE